MNPQTLAQAAEPFEYEGKTYNLGVADYELELYFQVRHEAWVRNRIEATGGMVSADVHRADVDAFARQRAGNLFAFGAVLSMQWLLSDEGFAQYAALLSGKGKKEQGGALLTQETLRTMRKEDRPEWDRLVRLILGRLPKLATVRADAASHHERVFQLLCGEPWFMGRREILGLSYDYVCAVILCPRRPDGMPIWKEEAGPDLLYDLAVQRGLPHEEALKVAGRMRGRSNGRSARSSSATVRG